MINSYSWYESIKMLSFFSSNEKAYTIIRKWNNMILKINVNNKDRKEEKEKEIGV